VRTPLPKSANSSTVAVARRPGLWLWLCWLPLSVGSLCVQQFFFMCLLLPGLPRAPLHFFHPPSLMGLPVMLSTRHAACVMIPLQM
jgi:hypothetical protein